MKQMKPLVQTILEQETDPTFIDDIISIAKKKNQEVIVDILTCRKEDWLSKKVVDWVLEEYGAILKDTIQSSYHPFIIRYLQQYALKKGIQYWNIAQHLFRYEDMVYDFFSWSKSLYIRKHNIDDLVQRSFSKDTMLLGSSFVLVNQENMYFVFSKIEKKDPDERGVMQGKVIEKGIMSLERKWLNHISWYIQDKFSDYNLFELLNIDPEEVL